MNVYWSIGDRQIGNPQKKGSGVSFTDEGGEKIIAKLNFKLEEEHYSQKLKCKAVSQNLILEREVTLLMESKF